jgi:aminoglycoside phosphotransferase family enzyme/predicted kinase
MSQDAIVAALAEPRFYPHHPAAVEHVQTHISHVFLAGPYVYKLKKDVRFPFLDFGTVERRRFFCEEELRLNRRLSPAVYLDVLPITRDAGGALHLAGAGDALDHVVCMRRLPADRTCAALLMAGRVTTAMLDELTALLVRFHAAAPAGAEVAAHADPAALRATWEQTLALAAPLVGRLLDAADHEILADFGPRFLARHAALFRARQSAGRIREGHGDVHGEHVYFVDAAIPAPAPLAPLAPGIYVVDCIEFSQPLRCTDVASEIAFTAMDLTRLGRPDLARHFVERYVAATGDAEIRTLLPFYACHRACVRGAVEGLKAGEDEVAAADRDAAAERARAELALAQRYAWQSEGPAVIACTGLSGTGKSALAAELARATGYVLQASDVLRKRRAGLDADVAAPPDARLYTPAARAAVYEALVAEVESTLAAGAGVIADATFIRRADRDLLAGAVARRGRRLVFVECRAEPAAVRQRLADRHGGPSDARWETYLDQRRRREVFGADEPHLVVVTDTSLAGTRAAALRALWRWYRDIGAETPITACGR